MYRTHRLIRGFTLIEIMLSVAIIAVLAGMSIPLFQSFQNRNNLHLAASSVAFSARRAHTLAQMMSGDSSWGVSAQSNGVVLFKGSNYASRDVDFDELTEISSAFEYSGTQEFVFQKFTGNPVTPGSLTITSPNNETKTVTINAKGTIDY